MSADVTQLLRRLPREAALVAGPPVAIRRRAERRLRHLLTVAAAGSPWWRQRLAGIDPDRATAADLVRLPVLTRADLMAHWDDIAVDPALRLVDARRHLQALDQLAADEGTTATAPGDSGLLPEGAVATADAATSPLPRFAGQFVVVRSSGTSGVPVVVPWSAGGWVRMACTAMRGSVATFAAPGEPSRHTSPPTAPAPKVVTIFGTAPGQLSGAVAAAWSSPLLPIIAVPAVSAGATVRAPGAAIPAASLLQVLRRERPTELRAYPSVLRRLAVTLLDSGARLPLDHVGASGERLTPATAALVARAFGCWPTDAWGTTETGWIALSDTAPFDPPGGVTAPGPEARRDGGAGRGASTDLVACPAARAMVLAEDACIVENVDDHNRAVLPGQAGTGVLLTPLCNPSFPLVRYRVDDRVVVRPEGGRQTVTVLGRSGVRVPLLGMDVSSLLDRLEAALPCADYCVRPTPDGIAVEVVGLAADRRAPVRARLRAAVPRQLSVDLVPVSHPRLLASGKAERVSPEPSAETSR